MAVSPLKAFFRLFVLLLTLIFSSCTNLFGLDPLDLDGEWEIYWDERENTAEPPIQLHPDSWKKYNSGVEPEGRYVQDKKILWFRRILPHGNFESPHILIRNIIPILEMYVDDSRIAKYGMIDQEGNLSYRSEVFPVIKIPKDYAGRYLYLKMLSRNNLNLGINEAPLIGDYKDLISIMMRRNQGFAALGFLFLFIGTGSIYLFMVRFQKILISFAVMCLATGSIYSIQSGFFGILWYDDPPLLLKAISLGYLITPIGSVALFYNLFGKGYKHVNILLFFFYTLILIIGFPLIFLELAPVQIVINISYIISLPIILYQMIYGWIEVYRENKFAIYYSIGITCLGLASMHDILATMGFITDGLRLTPQGFLVMIGAFGLLLEQNIRISENELASFEKEIDIAAKIQKAIIPQKTPDFFNIQFESYYKPMLKVGGDFFDYVLISEGVYGFLIADVSGHGVGASIIAAMSRIAFSNLHAFAYDPALLLKKMNQSFMESYTGQFITAGYLVIDTKKKKLKYASAGHDPAFLVKENGESIKLKPHGKPLGITSNLQLETQELNLERGSRILMYTDGLTDMSLEGWDGYGDDTVFFTLCSSLFSKMTIIDLKEKFIQDVNSIQEIFPEGIQDDITFLIIDIGKI